MNYFSEIPEGQAIIQSGGVYRQVPIFMRTDAVTGKMRVYAKFGGGYVRLSQNGVTSKPKVHWAEIDPGSGMIEEAQGTVSFIDAKPVDPAKLEAAE